MTLYYWILDWLKKRRDIKNIEFEEAGFCYAMTSYFKYGLSIDELKEEQESFFIFGDVGVRCFSSGMQSAINIIKDSLCTPTK